jgi:adenine-specific DNA-methyltransferase
MLAIFDGMATFDTPKPTRLIQRILEICPDKNALVLDSFAGSGTTAHAVLNLNKRDSGDRKFILVEMEDYAERITAERVRRVIDGYGDTPGTGGGFAYCELGERLLLPDGNLNESLGASILREYVWHTETHSEYAPQEEAYLLGVHLNTAYYFHYEKGCVTALDHDFLRGVKTQTGGYLIYADINTLSTEEMDAMNIRFKKIPRDITRL